MMRGSWVCASLAAWCLCGMAQSPGWTQDTESLTVNTAAFEEVWLLPGEGQPTRRVSVAVTARPLETSAPSGARVQHPAYPAATPVPLECGIVADSHYEATIVRLILQDPQGNKLNETQVVMPLSDGLNTCIFHLDAAALAPGTYRGVIEVDYTDEDDAAKFVQPLKKVTAVSLLDAADKLANELAELAPRFEGAVESAAPLPYEAARLHVARRFLGEARADAVAGQWQAMDDKLGYITSSVTKIKAGITFASLDPEHSAAIARPAAETLVSRDGGVFSGDTPVYLFGAAIDAADATSLPASSRLGFNFGVLDLSPSWPAAAPVAPDAVLAAAAEEGIALAVQVAPSTALDGANPGHWPVAGEATFADLTLEETRQAFNSYAQQLLPQLAAHKVVIAASIANNPHFKFQGAAVKTAWIEQVRKVYPDRHDVNEAWRSHLATYEEIEPWASKPDPTPDDDLPKPFDPLSSYQDRRAYQWDWQTFHLGLGTQYFQWLQSSVKTAAPGLPLMATLDDGAFEPGDLHFGVDAEAVLPLMDISGCQTRVQASDTHFAFEYPHQSAQYAVAKTLAPSHPVFNLRNDIELLPREDARFQNDFVRTVLWEGAVSGMTASALPRESEVLKSPEALEGYVFAGLDLNRLAPVVYAFQSAPVDVAILLSKSSTIFDEGLPHLQSAIYAYEGCSFSGYHVRFITEDQVDAGALAQVTVLVVPETPSLHTETFDRLVAYVEAGGTVLRVGTPIPYTEHGQSRQGTLGNTAKTVLVRGMNLPTEYLHAMDAVITMGNLPLIPRAINGSQYPIEGVKTRYVQVAGVPYLFLVNVRKDPVRCHLAGNVQHGRDLIGGRDITFPMDVAPLDPMLIRLDLANHEATLVAVN